MSFFRCRTVWISWEHDYENLIEQIRLANQQRFGRHTEKLGEIAGQLSFFNEAEANCSEDAPEPTIEEAICLELKPVRRAKKERTERRRPERFPTGGNFS